MPKSPPCFDLIQSLDKAEKIYFKRYLSYQSGKGEPTVYLKLFDELDKMADYDVERLERKFKGQKFVKHLPVSLNYLNNLLLNSLVNFHSKKDDNLVADEMLGEIRILFQKRLYKQCARYIKRARKFMEEREYYRHLYTLGSYEYNLAASRMQRGELTELKRINSERKACLRRLDDEISIFNLNDQLTHYAREKQLNPSRNFAAEMADIAQQLAVLKGGFEDGTTTFRLFFMLTTERLYYVNNQPIESLRAAHHYVKIRRNLSETLRYSHSTDLTAISNHLTKAIEMWFVDEAEYWLPELEVIRTQAQDLQHRADLFMWYFRFQVLLRRGHFEELANLVTESIGELEILLKNNVAYYRVWMFENLALYYFLVGNFRESLTWIDRIFEQKDTDEWIRQRIVNMRLIEIMAHFNLENYELVKSLCRSFERALKKLQSYDGEFTEELSWIKKIRKSEAYFLPRQMKDFAQTLLPEGYFSVPPNYRLLLMSVWAKAHHNKISLRESWVNHTGNILTEMRSVAGMEVLCFGESLPGPSG